MGELRIKFDQARRYDDQLGEVRSAVRATGTGAPVRKRSWGVAITADDMKLVAIRLSLSNRFVMAWAKGFSHPDDQ